jgi:hypothetical protein
LCASSRMRSNVSSLSCRRQLATADGREYDLGSVDGGEGRRNLISVRVRGQTGHRPRRQFRRAHGLPTVSSLKPKNNPLTPCAETRVNLSGSGVKALALRNKKRTASNASSAA